MKNVMGPSVFLLWTMRSVKYARFVQEMMNASLQHESDLFGFGTATMPFP